MGFRVNSNRGKATTKMRVASLALALLALASPFGCTTVDDEPNSGTVPPFIERGDLEEIRKRGVLRVLVPMQTNGRLPRRGIPLRYERGLVESYARRAQLDLFWVYVESRKELISSLLEGRGDVIVANLTATDERRESVRFTVPLERAREQVVTRFKDGIANAADLEGRRVAIRRSSSFWGTMQALQQQYPGIAIEEVPENLDTDELIHRVANRSLDVTVADSNLVQSVLNYRDDVRVAFDLTGERPIAWAVRPDSDELLLSLNRYLTERALAFRGEKHLGDLEEIKSREVLRVLTRNSAATYFLWRGELMGFEYELATRFAERHGLRVEVIVAAQDDDLLQWLAEGRGDVVAAALTPTETREQRGVAFSRPYNFVSQVLVARPSRIGLDEPRDLSGQRVVVRRSSSYWDRLRELRREGIDLEVVPAPEQLETPEIIALVADGTYDLTVSDSHILDIELTWRDDVEGKFPLGDPVPLAWGVRASNPELKSAINRFLKREYRGEFYNVIYKRYFKDPRKIRRHIETLASNTLELSPYDATVKRYAEQYHFDWRMIVAMMYQESQFDPEARSFAGAVGLLQILPRTARQLGFTELEDPETNIHAGVRYLDWVRDRFEEDLPVRDRMWFTLASYNVGAGHVRDARRLAEEQGWNPDKWFDHVEQAMLLLSRAEHARRAQHGYCRGSEPVRYVAEIKARYDAYREALDARQPDDPARS